MLLEKQAHYNDLSPKLRDELTEKIKGFGKNVRYKFDISNNNPDPEKKNGKVLWPNIYTLDPTIFNINDPHETDKTKSKSKKIALVEAVDDKGLPNKFKKIRVEGRSEGILKLETEANQDDFYMAMMIELHPKLSGGQFADPNKRQMITRIDEVAHAKTQRIERSAKIKAQNAAQGMSDNDLVVFADGMLWDSTQDTEVLRNLVEELAETDPPFFNDLVEGKTIEYRAIVKQALDRGIIKFDLAEYKMTWGGNGQTIVMLPPAGEKNEVEKMAEWLMVNGQSAYTKIKSLVEAKK